MSNTVAIKSSKTKSGKIVQVAMIPESLVNGDGAEQMHWRATEIAQTHRCSHYRVTTADGRLIATGAAGALPTQEQTARTHGDGSDWSL